MPKTRFGTMPPKLTETVTNLRTPVHFSPLKRQIGNQLVSIPLIRPSGKSVRAGLTLEEDVAEFIDSEARRRGMTRKTYITWVVRRIAAMGG